MEGGFTKNPADARLVSFLWKKVISNGRTEVGRSVEKTKKPTAVCHGCQQPLTREHLAFRRMAAVVALAMITGLLPTPAAADGAPVVITEIAAFEPADHEWIEIANRSEEPVDISGWKFFEGGTNHGLVLAQGDDTVLEAGEYAVIADVASNFSEDYPTYGGTLFDSSWSTLTKEGEEIALKDSTGAVTETFTYIPVGDYPLERVDVAFDDYSAENWKENTVGPTPGAGYQPPTENEAAQDEDDPPADESDVEEETNQSTSQPGDVVINEFVADPSNGGYEWIELWNRTEWLLDLHSWKLEDGAGTIRTLNVLVGPGPHVVEITTSKLNNSGDLIVLRDALGTVMDSVAYGSWNDENFSDNAPAPDDGQAVGRSPDGNGSFAVLSTPTPGAINAQPFAPAAAENQPAPAASISVPPIPPAPKPVVVISEIMPNPAGGDEDEWIELGNSGEAAADLNRWTIDDGVTTYFLDGRVIAPGSFLVLPRNETNIALSNSGREKLTLHDSDRKLVATVSYEDAGEGLSYALDEFGDWRWTTKPTSDAPNEIISPNAPPSAAVYAPSTGLVGELLLFDATDSVDPDGSELSYRWDFGDGVIGKHPRQLHAFQTVGRYRVVLVATDVDGATATKNLTVTIKSPVAIKPTVASAATSSISKPNVVKTSAVKKKTSQLKSSQARAAITGDVVALPGVLNKRSFLIETDSGPTEIYLHDSNFPPLSHGDRVSAVGRWSDRKGLRRLLVSEATGIAVIDKEDDLQPTKVIASDLSPEDGGRLVVISGEIVEKTRLGMILGDGKDELTISKPPQGWPSDVSVGSRVTIAGIVLSTPQGYKILPRNAEDITVDSPPPELNEERARPPPENPNPPLAAGLPAAAAALGVSAGSAVLIRHRRSKKPPTPNLLTTNY